MIMIGKIIVASFFIGLVILTTITLLRNDALTATLEETSLQQSHRRHLFGSPLFSDPRTVHLRTEATPVLSDSLNVQTHAVVHMGPHKTGTTSIQYLLKKSIKELKEDGYDMPWAVANKKSIPYLDFANCFFPDAKSTAESFIFYRTDSKRTRHPCDNDLLHSGIEIARQKRNVFVSTEVFSRIDTDGLKLLTPYLSQWDKITIVIYYRRFYDWLPSVYNQLIKQRTLGEIQLIDYISDPWNSSIIDFITDILNGDPVSFGYTVPLLERVEEESGIDNIAVMNFHDASVDLAEGLFCHPLLNAPHTCDATRRDTNSDAHKNSGVDICYQDLAYAAREAGLVNIVSDAEMSRVSLAAQEYQEKILNLTSKDFKHVCLPPDIANALLEKSLEYEEKIFKHHASRIQFKPDDMVDMKSDFEIARQSKLCKIDVDVILKDKGWRAFFQSFQA